jgi:hypothetical protein
MAQTNCEPQPTRVWLSTCHPIVLIQLGLLPITVMYKFEGRQSTPMHNRPHEDITVRTNSTAAPGCGPATWPRAACRAPDRCAGGWSLWGNPCERSGFATAMPGPSDPRGGLLSRLFDPVLVAPFRSGPLAELYAYQVRTPCAIDVASSTLPIASPTSTEPITLAGTPLTQRSTATMAAPSTDRTRQ